MWISIGNEVRGRKEIKYFAYCRGLKNYNWIISRVIGFSHPDFTIV